MPKKYYAIRKGHKQGIFESWDICKQLIDGFSGAEYKSFTTLKEARSYLNNDIDYPNNKINDSINEDDKIIKAVQTLPKVSEDNLNVFVDGSFDIKTFRYAFGCVIITPKGEIIKESGIGDHELAKTARNVAGELMGTMFAVKWAVDNNYKNIVIYHDYEGIAKWYQNSWKAQSYCAVEYIKFMNKYRPYINIEFEKVIAHTGVVLNELADNLAKKALDIK
ncbi:MAG: ribonuclease [Clostridia bacterium]|nr:ribonuclease [Clostridia bacterium]